MTKEVWLEVRMETNRDGFGEPTEEFGLHEAVGEGTA